VSVMGPDADLGELCARAMEAGREIDLSGCPYGETTGPCAFIKRPTNYYFFLAGFVRVLGLKRILEIGTNYGGSIMSMSKGLRPADVSSSRLVTIDLVSKNDEKLGAYLNITRIHGDSLDEAVIKKAARAFHGKKIDLIFIDSLHEYEHTKQNIEVYASLLDPRFLILDDIRQNDGMRLLWKDLESGSAGEAFDASDTAVRKGAGFGVIRRAA